MALKKRRRAEQTPDSPALPTGKAASLDTRKSAQDIQSQLNDRLASNVSKSAENVRLEKLALAKIAPDPDNQRTWYINQGTITILSQAFEAVWEEGVKSADLPQDILNKSLDQISRYATTQNVELPPQADVIDTVQGIWDFCT